jgi:hypothetical protein
MVCTLSHNGPDHRTDHFARTDARPTEYLEGTMVKTPVAFNRMILQPTPDQSLRALRRSGLRRRTTSGASLTRFG